MGVAILLERAGRIARAIEARFGIREPHRWRAKHLRWALERWASDLSPSSRYDYWRTARAIASALGRWPDWEPHLRGPWQRQGKGGGRRSWQGRERVRRVRIPIAAASGLDEKDAVRRAVSFQRTVSPL